MKMSNSSFITSFVPDVGVKVGGLDLAVVCHVKFPDPQVVRVFVNGVCKMFSVVCEAHHHMRRAVVLGLQSAAVVVLNPVLHVML